MTAHWSRKVVVALLVGSLLAGCTAHVTVEWSTETELNTAGFNVYRGASPDGPFDLKVNRELIPATGDSVSGGEYSFIDRTARPGMVYYYQLQEVEKNGGVNMYGPIQVRAQGLDWRHAVLLVLLGIAVVLIWVRGGRPRAIRQ